MEALQSSAHIRQQSRTLSSQRTDQKTVQQVRVSKGKCPYEQAAIRLLRELTVLGVVVLVER